VKQIRSAVARRTSALAAAALAALTTLSLASAAGGDLDPTFGDGGTVVTALGTRGVAQAVSVQRNGNVVVAGWRDGRHVLVRYRSDGTFDAGFGNGGRASAVGALLALLRDDRIVVAGAPEGDFRLVRHRADGTFDRAFGSGGVVTTDLDGRAAVASVLAQPDWKVVLVGHASPAGVARLALARYRRDGRLDRSFGRGGKVVRVDATARAAALGPGGVIVVVGSRTTREGRPDGVVVARFTANGALDRSFSGDGVVDGPGFPISVAAQPDGKVVVAAWRAGSVAVTRYRADGSLDGRFGAGGTVMLTRVIAPRALALDSRERIVVAGSAPGPDIVNTFVVVRLTPAGRLDRRFGRAGIAATELGRRADANAVAVQRDGKVVVAGSSSAAERGIEASFALARYLPSTCRVPNVTRKPLPPARDALDVVGCVAQVRHAYSRRVPRGRVISQRPAPGTDIADHIAVTLVVSRGKPK
jgi:uncharacterized delta-60 repeat protein